MTPDYILVDVMMFYFILTKEALALWAALAATAAVLVVLLGLLLPRRKETYHDGQET